MTLYKLIEEKNYKGRERNIDRMREKGRQTDSETGRVLSFVITLSLPLSY